MRTLPPMLLAIGLSLLTSVAGAHEQAPAPTATPAPAAAPAQESSLTRPDGAKIYYQVSGQGTPLFLIHGYPLSGELFEKNRSALESRFKVITLDQRGYGTSTAPSDDATVQTYAEDALAVMDQLKIEKAIIGGMSMGGPIAFEMYREAPERFAGLVLIDTTAVPANAAEAGLWQGIATLVEKEGVAALPPVLMKNMLTGPTRLENAPVVGTMEDIILEASQQAAVAGAKALATRPDSRPTLETIKVPTLVIVGIEDTIYPIALARQMQEAIPSAKLAIIPDAAHAAVIENPDEVNKAILDWAGAVSW